MHSRAGYCMLLVCVLAAANSVQARMWRDSKRSLLAPYGTSGLQLPLPGGGTAALDGLYVQGALCDNINPPPAISTSVTQSTTPLTLAADITAASGFKAHAAANIKRGGKSSSQGAASSVDTRLISYGGGEVMDKGANVYMIYIGYQPTEATPQWLNHLAANLGSTSWWATMSRYTTKKTKAFSTSLTLAGVTYIAHVHNNTDVSTAVPSIVQQAVDKKLVPKDVNKGIYVVVSKPDHGLPTCDGGVCGYHDWLDSGVRIAYMPGGCPDPSCFTGDITSNNTRSPTGNAVLDGVADTLVHELAETVTDPHLDAWADDLLEENGDMCQTDYGTPNNHTFVNGHTITYNQIVGGYPFIFQRIWDPTPVPKTDRQVGCVYGV